MKLKDFLDQIKLIEITAEVSGSNTSTFLVGDPSPSLAYRFEIEFFDGVKLERQKYKELKDIPENLLQAILIKTKIYIRYSVWHGDHSVFQFIVGL